MPKHLGPKRLGPKRLGAEASRGRNGLVPKRLVTDKIDYAKGVEGTLRSNRHRCHFTCIIDIRNIYELLQTLSIIIGPSPLFQVISR